jgi:hypothetical protein
MRKGQERKKERDEPLQKRKDRIVKGRNGSTNLGQGGNSSSTNRRNFKNDAIKNVSKIFGRARRTAGRRKEIRNKGVQERKR